MYSRKPLISLKHYTRTGYAKRNWNCFPPVGHLRTRSICKNIKVKIQIKLGASVGSVCKYITVQIEIQLAAGVGRVCKYIILQIQVLPGAGVSLYAKLFSLSALLFGAMHWFQRCVR